MTQQTGPSPITRAMRRMLSVSATLIVVGGAGFAAYSASGILASRADAVPAPEPAAATQVSVTPIRIEPGYEVARRFTGQLEAGATATLSFELGGRITTLLVEEGDAIVAGQHIARLDTALLEAEATRLTAARAALEDQLAFAQSRFDRAIKLQGDGFTSTEALDGIRATRDALLNQIRGMDAALHSVAINIEKSVLTAPFDGRIGAQHVDAAETLGAGQAVVTAIETDATEVRIGLPLSLDPDALIEAQVEIAGTRHAARLQRVRPDLDPLTRTRTALFAVEAHDGTPFGQTATLHVVQKVAAPGAWVPLDALQEGAGSLWTVLVVEAGIVRRAGVEVLHAEDTRVFVRGTFEDGAALIASGAHRLVPGQTVAILTAGE